MGLLAGSLIRSECGHHLLLTQNLKNFHTVALLNKLTNTNAIIIVSPGDRKGKLQALAV